MSPPFGDGQKWSTADVDPKDRFAYWRELLCANLIGITAEAPEEHRSVFEAEAFRTPVADTAIMHLRMKMSVLHTKRSGDDIRARPGDGVFLFRSWTSDVDFSFHDRQGFVAPLGATVLGGLDRERFSTVNRPGIYEVTVLRLPKESLWRDTDDAAVLDPRIIDEGTGAGALLHGFFNSFLREMPRLSAFEQTQALSTLAHLTNLVVRRDQPSDEPTRDSVRLARRQAVLDFIRLHSDNANLGPSAVARALGLSVRQVHLLMEPSGMTFSQHLAQQRVERVVSQLQQHPEKGVLQIAQACGFESAATFYRTFRKITGMAPRDARHDKS